jgi:hypothetical protein
LRCASTDPASERVDPSAEKRTVEEGGVRRAGREEAQVSELGSIVAWSLEEGSLIVKEKGRRVSVLMEVMEESARRWLRIAAP